MKLWKRAGSVGLSLVLCAGLVLPALAHTVTIDGVAGSQEVDTVQEGVDKIGSGSGTITMTESETGSVKVSGGNVTLDLNSHTLAGEGATAIIVFGGELTLKDSGTGGTVSGGSGVSVYKNGTANITGGTVSGDHCGVTVNTGGTVNISGNATVKGSEDGVYVLDGTAAISGGSVRGETNGVAVQDGTVAISGGSVSGKDKGVAVVQGGNAEITDGTVSGGTGASVSGGTFTMDGGTVGSTVPGGDAITGGSGGTIELNGGTLYGKVPEGVDTSKVTVKDGPYEPPTPAPGPRPRPAPAPDPLTRPAAAMTLLEELFRRAGGSGDLWAWAVENGLMDENGDGEELVTVALLRSILTGYAEVFGGNAVAVEELTTLTGEDTDVVENCRAVLDEFFGE